MAKWRRGSVRVDLSPQALAWNGEAGDMAMAGGVTAAYRCQVRENWLHVEYRAMPRAHCADTVEQAIERLERGEQVIVAGGDMGQLRTRLASLGIG